MIHVRLIPRSQAAASHVFFVSQLNMLASPVTHFIDRALEYCHAYAMKLLCSCGKSLFLAQLFGHVLDSCGWATSLTQLLGHVLDFKSS